MDLDRSSGDDTPTIADGHRHEEVEVFNVVTVVDIGQEAVTTVVDGLDNSLVLINQDGFDNMSALSRTACPMYGVAKGKTASEVNVPMKQLASVIEFNITNNTGSALIVNSVTLNATEDIVGTYYYDSFRFLSFFLLHPLKTQRIRHKTVQNGKRRANIFFILCNPPKEINS